MISILKNSLKEFLGNRNYRFASQNIIENSTIINYTSNEVMFKSKSRKIEMRLIDYTSYIRISCTIFNNENKSISLDKYLQQFCNLQNPKELFFLNDYEGDSVDKKLSNFYMEIKKYLDDRFYDILDGKEWIDISFDWHGYK